MKLLSEKVVRTLFDPDRAIRESADAFRLLSEGKAIVPVRTEIPLSGGGVFFMMPGLIDEKYLGFKLIASRPDASRPEGLRTMSIIMVIDAKTLSPLGLFSSDWFTDFRTAAGLAAATKKLALADARTLVIYGAGKLAEPSIRLLCRVRPIKHVIIVGRTRSRIEALVDRLHRDNELVELKISFDMTPDDAAAAADVITTVTSSASPVFDGTRVRPGVHINIAGAFRPDMREIDDAVAGRAFFYVDSLEATKERAGDIRVPLESGVLTRDRLRGEIGALFAGTIEGRRNPSEITVFKSLGNAVQDLHLGGSLIAGTSACSPSFDLEG